MTSLEYLAIPYTERRSAETLEIKRMEAAGDEGACMGIAPPELLTLDSSGLHLNGLQRQLERMGWALEMGGTVTIDAVTNLETELAQLRYALRCMETER